MTPGRADPAIRYLAAFREHLDAVRRLAEAQADADQAAWRLREEWGRVPEGRRPGLLPPPDQQ